MTSHLYVCVQYYRLMNVKFYPKTEFIHVSKILKSLWIWTWATDSDLEGSCSSFPAWLKFSRSKHVSWEFCFVVDFLLTCVSQALCTMTTLYMCSVIYHTLKWFLCFKVGNFWSHFAVSIEEIIASLWL